MQYFNSLTYLEYRAIVFIQHSPFLQPIASGTVKQGKRLKKKKNELTKKK